MSDNIKAFLVSIKNNEEWKEVYGYITNLQERCAYLERSNDRREDTILGLRQELYEQEDYKSRCEKASEYINEHIYYASYDEDLSFEKVLSLIDDDLDNLLNIL